MPSRLCCPNYAIQERTLSNPRHTHLVSTCCGDISCHAECSEESEVCEWSIRNDFRFFTPLRCVQNDSIDILIKSKMLCVSNVNRA